MKMIVAGKRGNPNQLIHWVAVAGILLALTPFVTAQKVNRKRVIVPPAAPQMTEQEAKELSDAASQSRTRLIEASQTYRQSLERLLALQKNDEDRLSEVVVKNRKLLDAGLIARKQLEESEQSMSEAHSRTSETSRQIDSVDQLVAEVNAAEQLAQMPAVPLGTFRSTGLLIRYVGATRWAMSDFTKVDAFFRLKFSKPLPISAYGQSETHTRLGFDHHEAIDIAIHPDSTEGRELIDYLRSQGISFIAIRGAIFGSATGAHIHIGQPSRRK